MAEKRESNTFVFGDKRIVFNLSNENMSTINVNNSLIYRDVADSLIRAARNVRQQPLFSNIYSSRLPDSSKLDELMNNYPITPFEYQLQNVDRMLNHFEGRGVFGDQVGLGKTFEALMTAHAMFVSGTIRNALIVIPPKLVKGWLEEIVHKFPGVFCITVAASKDASEHIEALNTSLAANMKIKYIKGEDCFVEFLQKIDQNNSMQASLDKNINSSFPLYIITSTMLKKNADHIADGELHSRDMRVYADDLKKNLLVAEKMIVELRENVEPFYNVSQILRKYGYLKEEYDRRYYAPGPEVIDKIIEGLRDWQQEIEDQYEKANESIAYKTSEEAIKEFKENRAEIEERSKREAVYNKLRGRDGERIVDLLIVDEVHSFYEIEKSEEEKRKKSNQRYEKVYKDKVDLLADISKKFCVLLSATPVRNCLEDIFDLIYIIDKERLGGDREESKRYFYETICGVVSDEPFKLNAMMADTDKEQKLFGLINNYFTRKRICEVKNDMKGRACNSKHEQDMVDKYSSAIIEKCALMYSQESEGRRPEWCEQQAATDYDDYKSNRANGKIIKDAIDAVLIDRVNDPNSSQPMENKRILHSLADWSRRQKQGIALLVPSDSPNEGVESEVSENIYRLVNAIYKMRNEVAQGDTPMEDVLNEFSFYLNDSGEHCDRDIIRKTLSGFYNSLQWGATICYVSRVEDRKKIKDRVLEKYENKRTVVSISKAQDVPAVTQGNYNPFVIVTQGFQAGINLQQYATFVFAQMDLEGNRLLEPVDIEQWIGRIYRTGQVKTCRIITILATAMNPAPPLDFLKWYYEVLSDQEGFDLYGDSTPDVAFLQPVVTDILRAKLSEKSGRESEKINKAINEAKKSILGKKSIEACSFPKLLRICFEADVLLGEYVMRKWAMEKIRELCQKPAFGKPNKKSDSK